MHRMSETGVSFKIIVLILTLIQKIEITVDRIATGRKVFPSKFRLSLTLKRHFCTKRDIGPSNTSLKGS